MIDKIIKHNELGYYIDWDFVESIPEFKELQFIEQSPYWHAEGSAWVHTKRVVDEAITLSDGCTKRDKETLILAALFHDIGKISTTFKDKDGLIHSYNHEIESDKITKRILWNIDIDQREDICNLVKYHMIPHQFKKCNYKEFKSRVIHLLNDCRRIDLLPLLHLADVHGSIYNLDVWKKDIKDSEIFLNFVWGGKYNETAIRAFYLDYFPPTSEISVMIGLPGSGKSTTVNTLLEFSPDSVVLSRDAIRIELGISKEEEKAVGTREQEDLVSDIFNKRFIEALNNKKDIIIDNINLRKSYRDCYKQLAKNYNVSWRYYYIQANNLETNYQRRPEISKEAFDNMLAKFDYPDPSEYDIIFE